MKPIRIFIYLLVVFAISIFLAYIFPEKGVRFSDKFVLKFHWDISLLNQKPAEYADISEIIEVNEQTIIQDSVFNEEIKIDTIRAEAQKLKQKIQPIEYPAGDSKILYTFSNQLSKSKKQRVRVLHYGDSQIEGDRITGYLRNKFQRMFGGSGPGFMPLLPRLAESASIVHKASSNWHKHAVYYKRDTILPHRKFGALGSFARFSSYKNDSLKIDTNLNNAWVEFSKSGMAYRSVRNFNEVNVYFGHCNESFIVKGFVNDSLIWFEMPDTGQQTQQFKWQLETPPDRFKIEFQGNKSPDIYGISLDASVGVAVDNLPFRGSSGTEFTRLDYTQLRQMVQTINPGLVIMQFGVNVVPYKVKGYKFYENSIARQIRYLKAAMPNTQVLIVSVSDMSQRKGDYYESYSSIKPIIEAQRNAALKTNSAFWNLYEAMGGENSMPSWVFAQPPLANKDFIHFNRKGGHIVSQMLFNAIINEYNTYKADTAANTLKPSV